MPRKAKTTKPNQFRNQHKRRIVQTESAVKEDVKPGHIIRFSYSGKNVNDPQPMVLVLHPNWQGKLHGINIDYVPERVLQRLWNLVQITLQGKIETLAKLRLPLLKADIGNPKAFYQNRLRKFMQKNLGSTNVAYRTYRRGGVGKIRIVDYRFKDSVWEKKVRAEAEKIEERHGIERQGDKDTHKGN